MPLPPFIPTEFTVTDNLTISTSDRVSIFGRTGSGKTFLSKNWLLLHYNRYVFWDVKLQNSDVKHDILIRTPKELKEALDTHEKILYQPKSLTDEDFNDICEIIFKHGNTILYVDESSAISTPVKIQYWHKMLVTQGRSYNVGAINVSQRPRDIHNTLISESEHFFVFSLNLETDISKLRQQLGDAADEIRVLPERHFLYYNVKQNKAYIFKPVRKLLETPTPVSPESIPKLEKYTPTLDQYILLSQRFL